jgi:hypothetical protein
LCFFALEGFGDGKGIKAAIWCWDLCDHHDKIETEIMAMTFFDVDLGHEKA